jgi:hypothetical protein
MKSGGWVGETSESRGTNGEEGGALSATAAPRHTTRGGAFGATADVRPGPRNSTRGEDAHFFAQSSLHWLIAVGVYKFFSSTVNRQKICIKKVLIKKIAEIVPCLIFVHIFLSFKRIPFSLILIIILRLGT